MTFSVPEFNLKKQMCSSWAFHVDDRSESSSTYDMIMGRDLLGELGTIMNFNDHTVTWDTETIPMKDRGTLHDLLCYKGIKKDLHSSIIETETKSTVLVP
jgi:hypothetical protein